MYSAAGIAKTGRTLATAPLTWRSNSVKTPTRFSRWSTTNTDPMARLFIWWTAGVERWRHRGSVTAALVFSPVKSMSSRPVVCRHLGGGAEIVIGQQLRDQLHEHVERDVATDRAPSGSTTGHASDVELVHDVQGLGDRLGGIDRRRALGHELGDRTLRRTGLTHDLHEDVALGEDPLQRPVVGHESARVASRVHASRSSPPPCRRTETIDVAGQIEIGHPHVVQRVRRRSWVILASGPGVDRNSV